MPRETILFGAMSAEAQLLAPKCLYANKHDISNSGCGAWGGIYVRMGPRTTDDATVSH